MHVQEVMTRRVHTATPTMSLARAQRRMHAHRLRHLPVVAGERLVGIVTDRDLRQAAPSPTTALTPEAQTYYLETTPVTTCMTGDVVTIPPTADIAQGVCRLLAGPWGCLPVVAGRHLVGIVTASDLLRGVFLGTGPAAARQPVSAYMQRAPLTGRPEELVWQVAQRMRAAQVRHLPIVTAGGTLQGILTDRDLRSAGPSTIGVMAAQEPLLLLLTMPVHDVMIRHVYTVRADTSMADACQQVLTHTVGCLPVVRQDGTLEGLLTRTDMLRAAVDP